MHAGQVLSLIILEVEAMVDSNDPAKIRTKHKAITALLPYAIWQDRDGQPEMLDTFVHAARASGVGSFVWRHFGDLAHTLLHEATPRTVVLVLPFIPLHCSTTGEGLVRRWMAAASTVQHTEVVAQCVVDTLLRVSSAKWILPHITVDIWSWLTKGSSLPPAVRFDRSYKSSPHTVRAVRELGDIEILKSYFLVLWYGWSPLWDEDVDDVRASLREDFDGYGMGHHRTDLVQRLDQVLERLDHESVSASLAGMCLGAHHPCKKRVYRELKDVLLDMNIEAVSRTSHLLIMFLCMLT